ncbi:uncharacterized protein LOC143511708 [Brachyhypopomus gauderio]|uniref:uncharacterized protein LOC143511708 n=1 Tax=Brachyhypopomus gauderio TaxID=698409 RepID=UPI00404191A8
MFSSMERGSSSLVLSVLHEWDQGGKTVRVRMLREFLSRNTGKTSQELELEFGQAGSLFLARLTAWIRLTYMFGCHLELQLRALEVFLSAAGTHMYLMEFLEMGGVLTLLEVLGHSQVTDKAKTRSLHLLHIIANKGRTYKELICESYGVKAVAECLAAASVEETRHAASFLLESLAQGNPRYQQQVYKGLVALLSCSSPKAQQLVLQALHTVQVVVKAAHPSIVEPLLNLLRSLHLEVQYEAIELIRILQQTEVRAALLGALVTLLKPAGRGVCTHKILQDPEMEKLTASLPTFVQQAAAAKVLRMLAEEKQDISEELIHLGVVHHLLYAMGNREHADTQRQASLTLEHFVRSYPVVASQVRTAMGQTLFDSFMHNAELLYMRMDHVKADLLLSNKVNILRGKRTTVEDTKVVRSTKKSKPRNEDVPPRPCTCHYFHDDAEASRFRSRLLCWYDDNKRDLPWRAKAITEKDVNVRTYAVWVSEVMLQQTQVATVTDYYNRWMKRWPTVQDLADASVEDVNKMWAGLGYYSRGRRLHQGAQKVVSELGGEMPRTTLELLKQLPGVGRYTAGAVGSIALGLVTGAVDGNVVRVLCRLRVIGADCTSSLVTDTLWGMADALVDRRRPGDFNQALMELGALVCMPKSPLCPRCPVQMHCHAYGKVNFKQELEAGGLVGKPDWHPGSCMADIEDCAAASSSRCELCLSEDWASDLGVQNYPRRPVKKAPRVQRTLVCVLERQETKVETLYLLTKRPNTGLLAGMWELPSVLLEEGIPEEKHRTLLSAEVQRILGTSPDEESFQYLGEVIHFFSHIHQTYVVYRARVGVSSEGDREAIIHWLSASDLQEAAVSTGVKKIMKLYFESMSRSKDTQNKTRSAEGRKVKQSKPTRKRQ